ncbi:polysaccharide export protein [Paraliomyxa miuraensis]|nr:polysaccharide export protein [Paraliomyxa miuraensis]
MLAGRLLGGGLLALATCRPGPAVPVAPAPSVSSANQTLGPGDVIAIRVTDQEELTGEYEVAADGTIRFPWIEQVEVAGRSQGQIAELIEQRLADGWLRQPQVSVRVITRQNREVSVLGQVNEPGSYPFKERLTLVQAISLAGGMNPLAQAKRVKLIRETDQGTKTYEIDVREILESRRADLPLEPGDIVFVPEAPI